MTENRIPVYAEWALQGKTLGREGARVLACSSDKLNKENFTELISRFSLGTPDRLPQVSVSFLTSGTGAERVYYLGMAIHKWAADVQTDGGALLEGDDDNRPVAVTAYFCVPYQPLAAAAVSYQAMYQEFDSTRLGTTSGPPLPVKFPVHMGLPAIDTLAIQSASRLLTGRPVCVLGAESTTVAERLEFISAVAALLPYGFRTRLAAATWVRPTHRDHRFRLFFSAAKRDTDPPDDLVYWGHSEWTALTPNDDFAHAYDRWLSDTVGPLKALARLTTPRSFNREEVLASLKEIGYQRSVPDERGPDEPEPWPEEPETRQVAPKPSPREGNLDGEKLLLDCASFMQTPHLSNLNIAITRLMAKSGIRPEERSRYQEIIKEQHLFRHDQALGNFEAKLRDALFKVAFVPPLRYTDYCLIEGSVGADSPDLALLWMIVNMGISGMHVRAVIYGQLLLAYDWLPFEKKMQKEIKEIGKRLDSWYASGQVTAVKLINAAAGRWYQPRHAFYTSVTAADFMSRISCEPRLIQEVLQGHSYLARLLQTVGDGQDSDQLKVLRWFLATAYPNGLSEEQIHQTLIEVAEPPSQALLAAVLLELARPDDAQLARLAREAYVFRTTIALKLKQETLEALRLQLPFANEWPGDPVTGLDVHPLTDET